MPRPGRGQGGPSSPGRAAYRHGDGAACGAYASRLLLQVESSFAVAAKGRRYLCRARAAAKAARQVPGRAAYRHGDGAACGQLWTEPSCPWPLDTDSLSRGLYLPRSPCASRPSRAQPECPGRRRGWAGRHECDSDGTIMMTTRLSHGHGDASGRLCHSLGVRRSQYPNPTGQLSS